MLTLDSSARSKSEIQAELDAAIDAVCHLYCWKYASGKSDKGNFLEVVGHIKAVQSKLDEALKPDEHECDGCDGCGKCQCKELPELHDEHSTVVLVDAPEGVYLLEVSSDVWEMFRDTYLSQGIRGDNALQRALTEWVRQEAENG